MTINEKLNLISDLESVKFKSTTIESIVESIEHPESLNGPFETVDDLWKAVEENKNEKN